MFHAIMTRRSNNLPYAWMRGGGGDRHDGRHSLDGRWHTVGRRFQRLWKRVGGEGSRPQARAIPRIPPHELGRSLTARAALWSRSLLRTAGGGIGRGIGILFCAVGRLFRGHGWRRRRRWARGSISVCLYAWRNRSLNLSRGHRGLHSRHDWRHVVLLDVVWFFWGGGRIGVFRCVLRISRSISALFDRQREGKRSGWSLPPKSDPRRR